MSNSSNDLHPHVALLPVAGMGHLTPFLRLAASLVRRQSQVTLITPHPIVSQAESEFLSRFLSAFPQVKEKQFHTRSVDPATANSNEPFWLRWEATRRALNLLSPFLSSLSPPLSALVFDSMLTSVVIPVAKELSLPTYVLYTSSARWLSFVVHYPALLSEATSGISVLKSIEIPGITAPIDTSSLPPILFNQGGMFASMTMEISSNICKFDGILVNTFDKLESETLDALNCGKIVDALPPLFNLGLTPSEFEKGAWSAPIEWLDDKPTGSVVYVCFGSRTAMSREQIREVGEGLINSGHKFLWIVKDKIVDREEEETIEEVLGAELAEKVTDKGYVAKEWVDQGAILSHKAVGGFVSHCGWNSVVEAAFYGVRLLAWPQGGDQKINAEVAERSGLGLWEKSWGWPGEMVVKGEEIGRKIEEMMKSEVSRLQAADIGEEFRKSVGAGGSFDNKLEELIQEWKNIKRV